MVLDCRHWILLSSSCTLVWLGIEFIPLQTMSIYNKLQILHTKEIFTEGSWIFSRITASAWNLNSLVMSWDRWLCREKFKKRSVLFKLRILQAAYPCLGIIRSNWSLKILRSTDKCTPWKASSHFREREEYEFKNHEGVGRRTLRAIQCAGHVLFLEWAMVLFPSVVDSML